MESCFSRIWQTKSKKLRRDLPLNSNGVGVLVLHVLRKGSTVTLDSLFVKLFSNNFAELCRTSGLLWKGFVGSCLSTRRDKATFGTHLIQSFGGGFCFWSRIHVAYFAFSPGILRKVFLFCLSILYFEAWNGVLALVLVAQSCSFASRRDVDKMRKNN